MRNEFKTALPLFRRHLVIALIGALHFAWATAQGFPDRPIRLIVPYAAGTGADIATRRIGAELSKIVRQPVITENRAGAGGVIGATYLAQSPPDGYTLGVGTIYTHALNLGLYRSLPYDPVKDFVPITRFMLVTNVLVVPTSLKVDTLPQLLDLAKNRRQTPLTYGSGGNGTSSHLSGAQLKKLAGIELLHVPYNGSPAAITDLIAGRTDMFFGNMNVLLPHIKAGSVKALAISAQSRSPLLPDVPTLGDFGLANVEIPGWNGFFAPAGTSPAIAQALNLAIRRALESPAVLEYFEKSGNVVETDTSPAEFARALKTDIDKWVPVAKASGATVD